MLRFPIAIAVLLALTFTGRSFAFECPSATTLLERKDEVQWMKACRDLKGRLHGPFEVWTRLAIAQDADQAFRKTTDGRYAQGNRVGIWSYWNIEGIKVTEKLFQ